MFVMTLVHFAILSLRGRAFYNYYHYYADQPAMFDWLAGFGLTAPPVAEGQPAPGGLLEFLGWVAHGDPSNLAGTERRRRGAKHHRRHREDRLHRHDPAVADADRAVRQEDDRGRRLRADDGRLRPVVLRRARTRCGGWSALTVLGAVAYGPTIPVLWSMFADVADFSEWKTGRSATGIVFATICFALKARPGPRLVPRAAAARLVRLRAEGRRKRAEALCTASAWRPASIRPSCSSSARCCSRSTRSTSG